jgi:hypothetical protein
VQFLDYDQEEEFRLKEGLISSFSIWYIHVPIKEKETYDMTMTIFDTCCPEKYKESDLPFR